MVRIVIHIALLALLATASSLRAQTTGTLAGRVTQPDGYPVQGVTIRLVGTLQGAISKADGSYLVAGIRPGDYEIKCTYVGYATVLAKATINPGVQTKLDLLLPGMPPGDTTLIVTYCQGFPSGSQNSSRTTIQGAVALSRGITSAGVNGPSIRGGRTTGTTLQVDEIPVSDLSGNGFCVTTSAYYPTVAQDVQAISFGSEYGDVLCGPVNTQTRIEAENIRLEENLTEQASEPAQEEFPENKFFSPASGSPINSLPSTFSLQ